MCQICGKTGHIALKCFYKFDLWDQNQKLSSAIPEEESSIPVQQSQEYIASPTTGNDASWFLDRRATHHVATTSDSMTTKSEYSGNGKLALGDGFYLPITHIGKFYLPTS